MSVSEYPLESRNRRVARLLDPDFYVLLGLGKPTSWQVDATPPTPLKSASTIPEPFIYIPFSIKKGATRSTPTSTTVSVNSITYRLYNEPSLLDIRNNLIDHLYLEVSVSHSILPAPSFRSMGVCYIDSFLDYEACKARNSGYLLPAEIDAVPLYLENFQAVQVQTGVEQVFKVVIEVK